MTWVRLDDAFADHPKVMALGRDRIAGLGVWVAVACYSARYLTDGFVPDAVARGFAQRKTLGRLVEVGLMDEVPGGYRLHDWLDYNPPREKVMADRRAAKDRMNKHRSSEPVHANNGRTTGEVREKFGDPVPVPSRPVPGDVYQYLDPAALYLEKVGRRPGQKERDWLEDLHVRYSRSELVRAMQAVEGGTNYLRRVDDFIEGRAA
jgi:hypothetical protein